MAFNVSPIIAEAKRVLSLVSPTDPNFEVEVKEVKAKIAELDPQHPKASTLSAHRRDVSERRIDVLIQTIKTKLHPPARLNPQQTLDAQVKSIIDLGTKLATLDPKALRTELKKLHPDVQNKIFEAVWIASGCVKGNISSEIIVGKTQSLSMQRLGERLLKANPRILGQIFPALTGNTNGTILDQVAADLRLDLETINGRPEVVTIVQRKIDYFRAQFDNIYTTKEQITALFYTMSPAIQQRLRDLGFQPPFYGRGFNPEIYKTLGAHYNTANGTTTFRVYAPNATKIELKLTAFGRVEHTIPMVKGGDGVWNVTTSNARPGRSYHFMVTGRNGGEPVKKVDPFAFQNLIHCREEGKDNHESVVYDSDKEFAWTDRNWMTARAASNPLTDPMTIYEVHPTSWKKKASGESLNWRELAPELAKYCIENKYTAVELMALFAHPQAISMGYQITSFYAPNSDMGTWEDLQFFVNYMHEQNVKVFADWVPAHFAIDKFALHEFDGSALFEDDDPNYATHPTWGTKVFDFKKKFTRDFLTSNADFLMDKLHLDGLRVDAVSSMLYLNYDRPNGNRRNIKGSEVDLDAKRYIRNLNAFLHRKYPGILIMAEESSGFPNVTRPAGEKGEYNKSRGLGFDMTWQMGFMNDSLKYWSMGPQERKAAFSLLLDSVESVDGGKDTRPRGRQVLAYSHDESANGKKTILGKMPGNTREEKFANGRLALAYQLLRGGGPTLDFMGNELLQSDEWHGRLIASIRNPSDRAKPSVQWEELEPANQEHHLHRGAQASRRDLNALLLGSPGLWDQTNEGLRWIANDPENCVLSLHRRGCGDQFACVFNTSDKDLVDYMIPLPAQNYAPELDRLIGLQEVYNTDDLTYGGQGRTNAHVEIIRDASTNRPTHLKLRLPPYTAIVLQEQFN